MKNNILKLLALALPLVVVLFACSEDFLDKPAQGALSGEVLGTSESGVDATLIATYKMLNGFSGTIGNTWGSAPSNYYFESAGDDSHKGSEPTDNPGGYFEISLYQWSTGLTAFQDKWSAMYEGVKRANNAINIAQTFGENGGGAAYVDRVRGEATFLRAWYHFELYKVYVNAPYFTEDDTDFQEGNSEPMLPQIIADIELAESLLPANKSSVGRVDKTVAQAFLGKVKMHAQDFAGAKSALQSVVSSGKYSLAPCYNDNFTIATQNNMESIFAFQASVQDGATGSQNTNFLERLAAPHSGSHTGCCGFHNPTTDFGNSFRVDADGLPVADWNSEKLVVGTSQLVDPRVDWTMGRTGVPYLDWGDHSNGWIRGQGWAGLYSPKKNMKLTSDPAGAGWTTNQLHAKNLELIRYADVLLLLAEAEVETGGSLQTATDLVNLVRERAGNCAQGPNGGPLQVPIDDPSITWASYKVSQYPSAFASQSEAREAVRRERRLELGQEGHRLFDLRRWGNLEEVITAYTNYEKTVTNEVAGSTVRIQALDAAAPVQARHYAFPIPAQEINLGNGALVQNPGF